MAQLTPMMAQYVKTKEEYKDCILFYRLGDFYEMFFDDALTASRELEITLTGKDCGLEERAPMCGIPFHAVEGYLNKLVGKGYKVAICEQTEDPKASKGLVKREVVRIVTPGTNLNASALEEGKNQYLVCIVRFDDKFGLSAADISTGEYFVTELDSEKKLMDEIFKFAPTEIISNQSLLLSSLNLDSIKQQIGAVVYTLDDWYFEDDSCRKLLKEHFKVQNLDGFGLGDYDCGVIAAGALLQYLYETQKNELGHMTTLQTYSIGKYMVLDSATRRNLELTETLREKQKRGSLLWVLDKTKTAMGARKLRTYIEQPLIDKGEIEKRYDAVGELKDNMILREEIREYLQPVYDLERLISRISYKTANPRDLLAFKTSLSMLPSIKYLLNTVSSSWLTQINEEMDSLEDICQLVEDAIDEDAPITIREGGIIKNGFHMEIDELRSAKVEGKSWLAKLEAEEREKTGIKNMKIKFNKVFGYYLEVTKANLSMVPDYYIRKQTLTNAERYITPELKELEDKILGSEEKLISLETELFNTVRDTIAAEVVRIQSTAHAIARLDVAASLAAVAEQQNFVRPKVNEKGVIDIKGGRHPVVEKMLQNDLFVDNDTYLDNNKNRISIITGPNMAGKSTYMRQTALIVLMAQIGSFVPASSAKIGIVDRIFTRVGASDDLASGQSTFMVEMTEVANILRNATANSLLVLDEIGRGTSTFDGLSIAWAVVEHISNPKILGAKTLFATHYHELSELEGSIDGVNNYCIAVKERGDDIVFLRKIVKGGADRSYGIQVAKLAGVPDSVIERAKEFVAEVSDADISVKARVIANASKPVERVADVEAEQISFFDTVKDEDILKELEEIDISNMTPIDAMNALYKLQNKLKNRW